MYGPIAPYTAAEAREFAEMAHEAARNGAKDMAWATSQAFYDLTRGYGNTKAIHGAFRAEIRKLEKANPVK